MKNMLSNINKNFFALVSEENFSFKCNNFLKNTYDIKFSYKAQSVLERNIDGKLINLEKNQKLSIVLSGIGALDTFLSFDHKFSDKFLFVSSMLAKKYDLDEIAASNRKVLFNYIFFGNDIPLEDKDSNINSYASIPDDARYISVLSVYIKEKHIVYDKKNPTWSLLLEEI